MYTENRTGASAYPAVRRRLQNLFYTTALFQTRYGQESALWEPVDTVLFFFRFIIAFSAYYLYACVAWENTFFPCLIRFHFPLHCASEETSWHLLCTFMYVHNYTYAYIAGVHDLGAMEQY